MRADVAWQDVPFLLALAATGTTNPGPAGDRATAGTQPADHPEWHACAVTLPASGQGTIAELMPGPDGIRRVPHTSAGPIRRPLALRDGQEAKRPTSPARRQQCASSPGWSGLTAATPGSTR